ncbi:MAG TPA: phosphate acyltransferase, partial [Nitrospirota bacterium]
MSECPETFSGQARITDFGRLIEESRRLCGSGVPPTIAVCAAEDEAALSAVDEACRSGLARAVLIGDRTAITTYMERLGMDAAAYEIVDLRDTLAKAEAAVRLVREGRAQMLMKGLISTTVFLHPVFRKKGGLSTGRVISHTAVLEMPGAERLIVMSDGGINIAPDYEMKKGIIVNAVFAARLLNIARPRVALLSASETADPKIASSMDAAHLAAWAKEGLPCAYVDGPLGLDIAVSEEAAKKKQVKSEVAGRADILIASGIEVGNVIYKSMRQFAGAHAAGIVVGAACPIVLTSRSDTTREKVNSIALAGIYASRIGEAHLWNMREDLKRA